MTFLKDLYFILSSFICKAIRYQISALSPLHRHCDVKKWTYGRCWPAIKTFVFTLKMASTSTWDNVIKNGIEHADGIWIKSKQIVTKNGPVDNIPVLHGYSFNMLRGFHSGHMFMNPTVSSLNTIATGFCWEFYCNTWLKRDILRRKWWHNYT